jgi:hypothetical protein
VFVCVIMGVLFVVALNYTNSIIVRYKNIDGADSVCIDIDECSNVC